MLDKLQTVLRRAQRRRYAVGAFNISNLEQAQAVVTAAAELRSPVILNTSEKALSYAGLPDLAGIVITLAKHVSVPIVLNLDHGHDRLTINRCLRNGWTGIMFDGSKLSFGDNVRRTAAVKRSAQRYQIGVEGEIGQVKYQADRVIAPEPVFATPEQARNFVQRTHVDALAVGIGNFHGLPVPGEHLDFDLLARIHQAVAVPLVLHGASGTSPANIKRAIRQGICKINIDTDLRLAFTSGVRQALRQSTDFDPRSYLNAARQSMFQAVKAKIVLFGSSRQAP